jgi:hypothetical protein
MCDKIVACRRELGNIGDKKYCCKTISKPNSLDWCDSCLKRLPVWPIGELDTGLTQDQKDNLG